MGKGWNFKILKNKELELSWLFQSDFRIGITFSFFDCPKCKSGRYIADFNIYLGRYQFSIDVLRRITND